MDDNSGVGQLRSIVNVRVLETTHAPSGLGLVTCVCLLPALNKARGNHSVALFFSNDVRKRGIFYRHRLEVEYSLPFVFDCFREMRSLIAQKSWFHDTSSAFHRLRKNSPCMGLASADAIEKVPCSLLSPT